MGVVRDAEKQLMLSRAEHLLHFRQLLGIRGLADVMTLGVGGCGSERPPAEQPGWSATNATLLLQEI
jgi:hypothetical protein